MTVPLASERNDYTGDGSTEVYAYSYRITAQTHLLVTVADADGLETTLTIATDYTVSGVGVKTGGDVTLVDNSQDWIDDNSYLATGYDLTIRHVVPLIQETDIRNQGVFYPETHEDAFDYLMWVCKQQQDEIDRSIKVGETGSVVPTVNELFSDLNAAEAGAVAAEAGAVAAQAAAESARDLAIIYSEALSGTSTSSVSITVAQKTFVTQAGKQFDAGMFIVAVDAADSGNYIYGQVNSYSGTSLVIDAIAIGGTGTKTAWNIYLSGMRGAVGATGATGPAGAGSGDVLGPETNSDAFIPQWDGANTKTLKNGIQVGNGASMIPQLTAGSLLDAAILPTIAINKGGTGQVTAQAAIDALLPSQTSASGKYLKSDGTNASWGAVSSPSNVLFQWHGNNRSISVKGYYSGVTEFPTTGFMYSLLVAKHGDLQTLLATKFLKTAGISTITVYANISYAGDVTAGLALCDVGGQQGSVSVPVNTGSYSWLSFTIDVSSLTNGSVYDVSFQMRNQGGVATYPIYCCDLIAFGS